MIARKAARFPKPIYEGRANQRTVFRLWWREDITDWDEARKSRR